MIEKIYRCDLCKNSKELNSTGDYGIICLERFKELSGDVSLRKALDGDGTIHVCVLCAKVVVEIMRKR